MSEFYRTDEDVIYDWGLIRFLNDLAFMKDKGEYDIEVQRQNLANARH